MKRTLIAASVMAASCVYPVAAAEINDKGARALKENLSYFLPDTAKSTGFLTVKPAGERYEISYDFAKLLKSINKKDFTVSGLKPYSVFAAPLDNGQWKFHSDSDMNFTVKGKMPDGKSTNLNYSVTDMVFSGIFDPAISYFRSGEVTSGPIRMVSKSGKEEVEASFASTNYSLASSPSAAAGSTDFTGKGSFSRFYERIAMPETPLVQIRAESLDFDVSVQGVVAEKLRNLVAFVLELVNDEKPSQAEIAKLKDLVRGAMPFFTALSEKITFNQFTVASPIGDFGVHKLDYMFTMSEPAAATRIGFGARVENISTPDGIIPPLYAQLVPDMAEMEVGVADLNFQRFVDTLMEMDFSSPVPAPEAEGERLGKAFLDDGQLTIDFPRVAAKSALYDVEASGKIKGYPEEKERYTLETSILARDVDKLIQYFQAAAKNDPELNQVSFAMMMAKGMAKTEPDGRLRWDIKFEDGKNFSVNGQPIQ
ncbi:hypothetical protein [Neorhizobium galegae]|uniref:hypothetical protein n=1 Tax=Neorhizobium galegae TaxID=399 RepID=UPI000621CCD7|nr:hypothetical protein [Neorhizobium galegae]CDZ25320.1 Mll0865 protein [Neorhizobium galegae bv. officinalis]KAA9387814.1 hypothetical protein F4V88_15790 [Neorhizobium galegae]KAB1115715.1 hypothetical protein F4V89_04670 [Neorhizobium galegae]MCM2498262.1 hypothetical protein [Neorhizobium galegae]MCQ1765732.1 hypothetical protein [Neorhizobium galegae]